MVTGLGIKSAMFPFHLWLPDAHGGATTASSSILSGLVLKGYIVLMIVLIMRVFSLELMVKLGVTNIILLFGICGMIFGSVEAIREHHIKRMLAYSSVAQIGYIFLGIGLGSVPGSWPPASIFSSTPVPSRFCSAAPGACPRSAVITKICGTCAAAPTATGWPESDSPWAPFP